MGELLRTVTDAAEDELTVITVTGSRTITDVLRSPTPITSVDISEIAVSTPSDTADALNTGRTRSAVPVELRYSRSVLSHVGLLRRHGPLLHGRGQGQVLNPISDKSQSLNTRTLRWRMASGG